jgi:hypothetical protein
MFSLICLFHYTQYKLFLAAISLATVYQYVAEGAVTQEEYDLRLSMKRFTFGGATLQRGQNILTGLEEPLQTTDVSDFVIFNWALGDSEVEKLNAYFGIEPGLQLAETTILEKDTKTYHLSLRAGQYKTALGSAPKAEWVTYVCTNDDLAPRVLVVEDIANPLYHCNAGLCTLSDPSTGLEISSKPAQHESRTLQEEWIKSFDNKFGVTGLISKVYYNGSLIKAQLSKITVVNQDLKDSVNGILGSSSHVTSFFFNENVIFGEVIKDTALYPQYIQSTITEGQGIVSGQIEENTLYFGQDVRSLPNYFISFEIAPEKVAQLEAAIGLIVEDQLTISPVRMTKNGEKKYILVVNIYSAVGITPGLRAEWSVFVQRRDKPDSLPYFMVIEASTSGGSLDPAELLTPPAEIFDLTSDNSTTSTHLKDGATEITASFLLHPKESCVFSSSKRSSKRHGKSSKVQVDRLCDNLAEDLYLANDFVYWSNAVADRLVYNEDMFNAVVGVASVSSAKIEIKSSKWLPFISATPAEIIFFLDDASFVINGWFTLEETALAPSPQAPLHTNYFEGHHLDFIIDEGTAIDLMPDAGFTPKQIKVLQGDPLVESYYVSWYLASMLVDSLDPSIGNQRINRANAFTYATDKDGKPTIVFIATIIQTPVEILANPLLFLQFRFEVEKLSGPKDPVTGEPAYTHY